MRARFYKEVYANEENGFCVCQFTTKDTSLLSKAAVPFDGGTYRFTAKGYHLPRDKSIEAELSGSWETGQYGVQFAVDRFEELMPRTEAGIVGFLGSGLIDGLGKKTAQKIVSAFGTDALQVMDTDPDRLLGIKGISKDKLDKIMKSYRENKLLKDIMAYLSPYNVGIRKAAKILEAFPDNTLQIIKTSPFELCRIKGFGFQIVDEIARGTSCRPDDPLRIAGALEYEVDMEISKGHLFVEQHDLRDKAYQLLNKPYETEAVSAVDIYKVLRQLVFKGRLANQRQNIYSPVLACYEDDAAGAVAGLLGQDPGYKFDVEQEIDASQKKLGITLSVEQKEAVVMCFSNRFSVITGGPGTGKTTTLRLILDIYLKNEKEGVLLAAPTGRASRRMAETTGHWNAKTLHSALGLIFDEDYLNDGNTLDERFVIVDEASMLDMRLAKELFTRLRPDAHLLLLGDADQLPSVGPGNVLRELLKVREIPVTRLRTVYRQAESSRIVINAHHIIDDQSGLLFGDDFKFIPAENDEEAAEIIAKWYLEAVKKSSVEDVQILSPVRERGASSAFQLNDRIRELVNPRAPGKPELKIGNRVIRKYDKVMQTKNKDEISNGDIGTVTGLFEDEEYGKGAEIQFTSGRVKYYAKDLNQIILAYSMTIHKSQGSEFPTVIIPLLKSHYMMLQRNLVYTAITRAQQKVILVGQKQALYTAVNRQFTTSRRTMLHAKIESCLHAQEEKTTESYEQMKIS